MKYKRVISSLLAAVMVFGQVMVGEPLKAQAAEAKTVTVDVSKTYQNIRGFGGINLPEWCGDLTESQRKKAFGNGTDELGLTVLRVYVNPDSSQWYKAVPTAKYASDLGATIFATPWEPPANLAESGGSNGKLHLPEKNYSAYAQHLNDFGTYMKQQGVNLYSISVQNEPDYASEWTYWSTDETTKFLANYGDKITSTKVMSPESFQYAPLTASWVADGGKKFYTKILNNSKAMANTDVFGTHMYGTARDWMDFPDLEKSGKEIWMTEVYVPNSDADSANRWPEAVDVAENIHNAFVVGNMSVYTWWYIRRSYSLLDESGKITKRGYCMAQYSKFIRPGYKRIDATEQPTSNVYVSAYKGDSNKVVIVAVNKGKDGYAQNFSLGSNKIANVDRYRTSASENLAETKNLALSSDGTSFFAQLPAESVSTFVITLNSGSSSGTTTPSVTAATIPDGWYYVKNIGTQKYLQVANNTGADSTNVEVGSGTGVAGQKWYLENKENGYVTLKNALGFMLDIQYGAKEDGTNIQTYSANGADAQVFKVVKTSTSNVYGITTKITSDAKALDAHDGANVSEWTYTGSSNQQWAFESTSYSGGSSSGGSTGGTTDATLLNTYGNLFGYSGTCINVSELKDSSKLNFLKKHYNSITLENEMKPDAVLSAWSKQLISVEQAKSLGYYIPSNYKESTVPKLNFSAIDDAMKICAQNGLKMRAHTLVWHSQTPTFFFRTGYNASGSYVSKDVMDARMEFYIRTVMNHVYDSQYGSVVYTWDVVNEYLNARTQDKSDWVKVYGEQGTSPDFVKKAFTIADDVLKQRNLRSKVSLFYNDFNTYMNQDDVVKLISYINSSGKVCNGIGMQSHLGTDFPSVSYYKSALQKFANAGLEIQITELDVANLKNYDQPQYYYDIASAIIDVKKSGGNITCFTLWGMWDSLSWITKMEGKEHTTPLLFTGIDQPKDDYYKVIKAYTDAGYKVGGSTGGQTGGGSIDTTGYTTVDLSTASEGSYNSSAKTLTLTDLIQARVNLPSTLKDGQTLSVVMNVTYQGTTGFRAWTTDAGNASNSNIFLSSDADLSKDIAVTFTASTDCDYLLFKGPDYQTNIDKLVINSIKVKYGSVGSVTLAKSLSEYNGSLVNNPLVTQKFIADPTCVVYNDRVYVYGTAEKVEFGSDGKPSENKFKTASLSVISSSDLVNWTDEGEIDVNAVTKGWANNSWAPSITSKVINGKTYFFLYFANGGNGIGVLRATSPLGPWEDPLGHALITRSTANCSNVLWLFDPAVMVDSKGDGYLAFGGGVPDGQDANPKTSRIVKLGSDMISLSGTPVTMDPPYLFEDSELNMINGKYVYSYCKNWNTKDGTSATIGYMTSDSPLSGYTYKGVIVKNPGAYFGSNLTSNNHHHMFEFKGQWYILYHTTYLEKQTYGTSVGYRGLNIDKVNVASDGTLSATMTYAGVNAVTTLNPYVENKATTMAWNGGIKTAYDSSASSMVIDNAKTGNWIGLDNVAFGTTGTTSIEVRLSSTKAGTISVMLDAPSVAKGGTKVGTVQIATGSSAYRTIFATLGSKITGTHDLYFVFEGDSIDVASWKFTEVGGGQVAHTHNYTSEVTKAATCIAKGVKTYTCTASGTCDNKTYTEEIDMVAHNYSSSYTVDVAATATESGSKSRHCKTSGCTAKADVTMIPATGSGIEYAESILPSTGFAKGTVYGNTSEVKFTVLENMSKKNDTMVSGYDGYYQGSNNPKVSDGIPTEGAAFKIEAVKNVKVKFVLKNVGNSQEMVDSGISEKVDSAKTYYIVDSTGKTIKTASMGNDIVKAVSVEFDVAAGETYYAYVTGSKMMVLELDYLVDNSAPSKNGLCMDADSYWRYYKNNVLQKYTGLVHDETVGWWYVENGVINFSKNGLVQNEYGWWCVAGGGVAFDYTGLWYDETVGWWYVENGAINFEYNGLIYYNDSWWCVAGGRVAFEYTGLWYDELVGWWFVENGMINFAYSGLVPYNNAWWCVAEGSVSFGYTGLWYDQNAGWWYVKDGQVDFNYSGKVTNGGKQYTVVNGQRIS